MCALTLVFLAIATASGCWAQSRTQGQTNEKVATLVQEFETLLSKGEVESSGLDRETYG
jgi:hypothetical protein